MKKNRCLNAVQAVLDAHRDNPKVLIRELQRLVREAKRADDYPLMGAAYCGLAETCHAAGDLNGLLSNSIKAVALLKDSDEHEMAAKAFIALGEAYLRQENHQMALISDEFAYELVRKHRIQGQTRIGTLNNLSVSYHMMGDTRKAIRLINEGAELMRKGGQTSPMMEAMGFLNMAEFHKDTGEMEAALEDLRSMSPWIDRVPFPPVVCDHYLLYAIVSHSLGDRAAGDRYTDAALDLLPENVFPLPVYEDLRQLALIVCKNGDRARAERILDRMTVFAEKSPGTVEQIIAARMMADFYRQFGDFERAAAHFSRFEELNDRHMRELKEIQLKLHRTTKNTEAEIRRLKLKMRKHEELASLEPLTQLLNRSALLRVSSEFIEAAAKRHQKVGIIFIDIDCFKACNDTYGHARGDEIIREVARACRLQETATIRFARYGGDEFLGITRGLTDEAVCEVARNVARTIRDADMPHEKNPCGGGKVTVSIGVVNVAITNRTDTILEIANYADKAVYYAKNAGKNAIYLLQHGVPGATFVRIEF